MQMSRIATKSKLRNQIKPRLLSTSLIILSLACLSQHAYADMVDSDDYEPWETCALCHSYSGDSVMAKFPKLNGQKASYLDKQIRDFKTGSRSNDGGQMSEMVSELTDQDIEAIVTWFSSQAHPSHSEPAMAAQDAAKARTIVYQGNESTPACVQCHSPSAESTPWIKGQHAAYIEKQLLDFKAQDRENDLGVMHRVASQLSDDDIALVAKYLSSATRDIAAR